MRPKIWRSSKLKFCLIDFTGILGVGLDKYAATSQPFKQRFDLGLLLITRFKIRSEQCCAHWVLADTPIDGYATSGPVSTWIGDGVGTPGIVLGL